jgi:hypothetical protein
MTELFITLGIIQVLIPLLILIWQWFDRSTSKIYWLFKTFLSLAYLITIAVAGLWNFLPFYIPYIFLILSMTAIFISAKRLKTLSWWKAETVLSKLCSGSVAILAVLSFGLMIYAFSGWLKPAGDIAKLNFPLANGTYYIANGGSNSLLNPHLKTLEAEKFRAFRGQSYAVDIMKINSLGNRANGFLPDDPAQYEIFNDPIYSPCDGTVLDTENERKDMSPPEVDRELIPGNHVLLECGEYIILLAHFKQGSVLVSPEQKVTVGQELGRVGNSGNTTEPHLHIHAQKRGATKTSLDGDPIWMLIDGSFLVRNQIIKRSGK